MTPFRSRYEKEIVPTLRAAFGYRSIMAVPKVVKAVVNVGLSAGNKDPKFPEAVVSSLSRITGQKPVPTIAKKSISNFKIRKGMTVGYRVTLRGSRMESFLEKLVRSTLPRVRDFRGIPETSLDARGNLSIGFKEVTAFPEIRPDEVERIHGLEVSVATSARTRDESLSLFKALGFPFKRK